MYIFLAEVSTDNNRLHATGCKCMTFDIEKYNGIHDSYYYIISVAHNISLVPSLSARQIFIAYSMKNRRGKSGSKRHDDACPNVTAASHVVYLIFVNVIVRLRHECRRVCKQRAKDTRTEALD